jgi:hypothetical protein
MSRSGGPVERYVVRIRGHLDPGWSTWFDNLSVSREYGGTTSLINQRGDEEMLASMWRLADREVWP